MVQTLIQINIRMNKLPIRKKTPIQITTVLGIDKTYSDIGIIEVIPDRSSTRSSENLKVTQ